MLSTTAVCGVFSVFEDFAHGIGDLEEAGIVVTWATAATILVTAVCDLLLAIADLKKNKPW